MPPFDAYAELLDSTWNDGWLSNFGPHAERFEEACRQYTGLQHVRAVANCDIGLTLTVRALGLARGDRVVLPSFTFPSTLHAVLWNGLEPTFADVDPETWCLTAETVDAAVGARRGADAILGTHAFLSACDVDGLEQVADALGAVLVFDAAQAFASWIGDRHIGTFGQASVFSFSPTKLATASEGGLAAFRDVADADRFAALRSYGGDTHEGPGLVGLNGRMSELHAALGCLTVARIDDELSVRERLVQRYRSRLGSLPGVTLQDQPQALRPTPTLFVVDFGPARSRVEAVLASRGIEGLRYFRPLHRMDQFSALPSAALPVTERLDAGALALPLHGAMLETDVDRVCDAIELALAG